MALEKYFRQQAGKIEKALSGYLPKPDRHAPSLYQAMRYAVMSGGKRIRPILALAACEAVGGNSSRVMPAACALEMIHSYSLVHDDLPCMDDDATRRGKPTCHIKYGEVTALLAGDALLTLAFKILSAPLKKGDRGFAVRQLKVTHFIAEAVGAPGMVGGQAADMKYQEKIADLAALQYINVQKTGALIAASVRAGACLGEASDARIKAIFRYGQALGLLFQIVDDILDDEGYAKLLGQNQARQESAVLCARAKNEIRLLGKNGNRLAEIADFVMTRKK